MANQTAEERKHHPTRKRLQDARDRGQVARSRDLSSAISLAGVTLALGWFGAGVVGAAGDRLRLDLSMLPERAHASLDAAGLTSSIWTDLGLLARMAGPPALVAAGASILASAIQVGFLFSTKAIHMNWSALSPSQGARRLAPMQTAPELAKALLGVTAIGWLGFVFIREFFLRAPTLMSMAPVEAASVGWDLLSRLLWQSSLALAILAAGDYFVQRYRRLTQLKMTRQEVKEDHKMQEGNPEVKARVRRVQREMLRKRMLSAVKTATVVITNPTHVAVALEYRRERMSAPVVVAKGQDEMAARIRALAREHGVPLVENVTLARALYKHADVGDTIPASLFGAVAEVLAYLVRLKQLIL